MNIEHKSKKKTMSRKFSANQYIRPKN